MLETDLAWAAGLIDGEGNFSIRRSRSATGKPEYGLALRVAMTDDKTIERLWRMFPEGIMVRRAHRKKGRREHRDFSEVSWHASHAADVIRILSPYLFTKTEEADLALLYAETLGKKDQTEFRDSLYVRMRNLKKYSPPIPLGNRGKCFKKATLRSDP